MKVRTPDTALAVGAPERVTSAAFAEVMVVLIEFVASVTVLPETSCTKTDGCVFVELLYTVIVDEAVPNLTAVP